MDSYRARYIVPGKFAPLKHFMVGVFVLAFGLETYHHHKYHSHGDEHGHDDAAATEKPTAAASAREVGSPASLEAVHREVSELQERVREMRRKVLGDA